VLSLIGRTATIFALCLSLGLHWLALQSVAWTTMLVENARHAPLSEAVVKTFDGAHPCDLCHAVAAGKKSEQKSEVVPLVLKMDLICPPATQIAPPSSVPYKFASFIVRGGWLSHAPPAPPPRFSSVS
jgi:hypothetical protein